MTFSPGPLQRAVDIEHDAMSAVDDFRPLSYTVCDCAVEQDPHTRRYPRRVEIIRARGLIISEHLQG